MLTPYFDPKEPLMWCLYGDAGGGKTTFAASIARCYPPALILYFEGRGRGDRPYLSLGEPSSVKLIDDHDKRSFCTRERDVFSKEGELICTITYFQNPDPKRPTGATSVNAYLNNLEFDMLESGFMRGDQAYQTIIIDSTSSLQEMMRNHQEIYNTENKKLWFHIRGLVDSDNRSLYLNRMKSWPCKRVLISHVKRERKWGEQNKVLVPDYFGELAFDLPSQCGETFYFHNRVRKTGKPGIDMITYTEELDEEVYLARSDLQIPSPEVFLKALNRGEDRYVNIVDWPLIERYLLARNMQEEKQNGNA